MAVAKITGQGLAGIAVSVALLWGCLITERLIVRQANGEQARALHSLRRMRDRQKSQPVAAPAPLISHPERNPVG